MLHPKDECFIVLRDQHQDAPSHSGHPDPHAREATSLRRRHTPHTPNRVHERARLVDLLARRTARLVTLTGPGGVGKTPLVLEVARRMADTFTHTICLVELAGVADEHSVGDAVAAALRLPTTSSRSSSGIIVDYLRDRTTLLVLDNCEHVVKARARLVQTLCREAAGLTVLATSRTPLRLAEEHVVRLEPFAAPALGGAERLTVADSLRFDAVQLFTNRAAQTLLNFTLSEANMLAVARICQRLDGIPLAIEIAAAQTRVLPVTAIVERLDHSFAWQGRRTAETMPRQRTLHTLIAWSYGLLNAQERSLLRRLAVFAGGWTLEAAEAVSAPGEPCAEILASLVDHSLVVFGVDADHWRYRMHETIRQFAQEQLRGNDQEAEALKLHAHYDAQLVFRAAENAAGQTLAERCEPYATITTTSGGRSVVARARPGAGACPRRAPGHEAELLGAGQVFPGGATLAPARPGADRGERLDRTGVGPARRRRAVLGDLRLRLRAAVRPAGAAAVSAARRPAGGDRRAGAVLRPGRAGWRADDPTG